MVNDPAAARRHGALQAVLNGPSEESLYELWCLAGVIQDEAPDLTRLSAYIAMYGGEGDVPAFAFYNLGGLDIRAVDLVLVALTCDPSESEVAEQLDEVRRAGTFVYDGDDGDIAAMQLAAVRTAAGLLADGDLPLAFMGLAEQLSGRSLIVFGGAKGAPIGLLWDVLKAGAPTGLLGV